MGDLFIFGDKYNWDRNWMGLLKNISLCYRFVEPDEARYKHELQKKGKWDETEFKIYLLRFVFIIAMDS